MDQRLLEQLRKLHTTIGAILAKISGCLFLAIIIVWYCKYARRYPKQFLP